VVTSPFYLFRQKCLGSLLRGELLQKCEDVFQNVTVTAEEALNCEKVTRQQANSKQWFNFRVGRVTAWFLYDSNWKKNCPVHVHWVPVQQATYVVLVHDLLEKILLWLDLTSFSLF
jgi:hypothetical protein